MADSLEGENICNSRGSEETVDTVPPGHFQVLRVTSELVVRSTNRLSVAGSFVLCGPSRPMRCLVAFAWTNEQASTLLFHAGCLTEGSLILKQGGEGWGYRSHTSYRTGRGMGEEHVPPVGAGSIHSVYPLP